MFMRYLYLSMVVREVLASCSGCNALLAAVQTLNPILPRSTEPGTRHHSAEAEVCIASVGFRVYGLGFRV